MSWFKVDDKLHSARKILSIPRRQRLAAVGLWVLAGSWSADQETDGAIPDYIVESLGGTKKTAETLVDAGLWIEMSGSETQTGLGFQFHQWDEYQPTKATKEDARRKNREKMQNWRGSNRVTREPVTGLQHGSKPVSNPAPVPSRPVLKELSSEVADATSRPEVFDLLDKLDRSIESNGTKTPTRNKKNIDAMRLLIDRDGYTPEQVAWIINWSGNDEFWRTNILSASKLREKFSQLTAKAGIGQQRMTTGFNGEIDVDKILGPDYWAVPAPPAGLSIPDEIVWKKAQRENRNAERHQQALKKLEDQQSATTP